MVTFVSLLQLIYDELKTVVQNSTSVATPDDHVGILDRSKDLTTPFFGFEWTMNPEPRGMGGNVRNGKTYTDNNGVITSVDKIRDYRVVIDIGVTVDGDQPRVRDGYLEDVQSHFTDLVDDSSKLHENVHRIREDGAIPSSVQGDGDVGVLLTYAIEFHTAGQVSIPAAETIDWGVNADGEDAYPEKY